MMCEHLLSCPQPPAWDIDWKTLEESHPWLRDLAGCPQDPTFHAEGDVAVHTRMVCEALAVMPSWRGLSPEERSALFAGALLHDAAKPACTRLETNGRVSTRGHSRRGAIMARVILWKMGVPFHLREQVCGLVRQHQLPFFLIERGDSERMAILASQTARCDHLAILAEADVRGRVCRDQAALLDNIALFVECCREHDCLAAPRAFPSNHSRFVYFQDHRRSPDYPAYDDTRCQVVLMSGLPAVGKDRWIRDNLPDWPAISLDALRDELGVGPTGQQGPVVAQARSSAREYLRLRQSFVWNATNLSRQVRSQLIKLFAAYRAQVRIVYVETTEAELRQRNRQRARGVPEKAVAKMLDRWEVPDMTEAHQVEWIVRH
jgi:predicted kinase